MSFGARKRTTRCLVRGACTSFVSLDGLPSVSVARQFVHVFHDAALGTTYQPRTQEQTIPVTLDVPAKCVAILWRSARCSGSGKLQNALSTRRDCRDLTRGVWIMKAHDGVMLAAT